MRRITSSCYGKRGVSIIELMVSIMIIVILSSALLPRFRMLFQRNREAYVVSNMHTLRVAAENFATMSHTLYPQNPINTVSDVLSDIGIPSTNGMRIADNCPATAFDVNTGTGFALLPGDTTFINIFLYTGNCLDTGFPPWALIQPYCSGQGTVFWEPFDNHGQYAAETYEIHGQGYRCILDFNITSGH